MSKIALSEEDQKIADELQMTIGSDELHELDLFNDETSITEKNTFKKGGSDIKYTNSTNVSISDSNDIRRIIADMLK